MPLMSSGGLNFAGETGWFITEWRRPLSMRVFFFEIFLGTASVSVLLEAETATRLGKILFKQDLFSGKSK